MHTALFINKISSITYQKIIVKNQSQNHAIQEDISGNDQAY